MPRGHMDLPATAQPVRLSKAAIFTSLALVDSDPTARQRILGMENGFRQRISTHLNALPTAQAKFQKFNTSPFVLMFYSKQRGYRHVSEIEKDIVPAKVFSSMETSAGRMVEEVVLPFYDWQVVPTQMHSTESLLDGRKLAGDGLSVVTLKSGPRCLNDEMAQNIGRDIATNVAAWAANYQADKVDFTYGVLYGTKVMSNKKDWHVLRSLAEMLPPEASIATSHKKAWSISYQRDGLDVQATVRVGLEWWDYLGGPNTWLELCVALIRACVIPAGPRDPRPEYAIIDLPQLLDLSGLPVDYNVSLLQGSQLEWLLFLSRHFCDELTA